MDADTKLNWLLETGLLRGHWAWHEVHHLIEVTFPKASEEMKNKVWEKGWTAYQDSLPDDSVYEPRFARLVNRVDPEFEPAAVAMAEFAQTNPDWTFSEHPDFHHYLGEVHVVPPATLPPNIDANPSYEAIRQLELEDTTALRGHEISEAITNKVASDPELGIELLGGAANDQAWESTIWRAVGYGLQRGHIAGTFWGELVAAATNHPEASLVLELLAPVALDAVENEPARLEPAQFEMMATALSALLDRYIQAGADLADPGDDLMFAALNTWPGLISRYFVLTAANLEKAEGDPCAAPGLNSYIGLVSGFDVANWTRVAWCAIGREFPYLWERCHEEFGTELLNLASWDRADVAEATWQGLAYARWSRQTVKALYDQLPRAASHIGGLPDQAARGLTNTLAGIAITYGADPTENGGWLTSLVTENDDATRANFAHSVRRELDTIDDEDKAALWETWLCSWLENRNQGFPVGVGSKEGSMILPWIFPLQAQLAALGPMVLSLPLEAHSWGFIRELKESGLPADFPTLTARLVARVVASREYLYDLDDVTDVLNAARTSGAEVDAIQEACNAIAEHGLPTPDVCQ